MKIRPIKRKIPISLLLRSTSFPGDLAAKTNNWEQRGKPKTVKCYWSSYCLSSKQFIQTRKNVLTRSIKLWSFVDCVAVDSFSREQSNQTGERRKTNEEPSLLLFIFWLPACASSFFCSSHTFLSPSALSPPWGGGGRLSHEVHGNARRKCWIKP